MLFNCHTWFSLRYGTFPIEALVESAARAGYTRLGISDINNSSAVIDFVRACNKHQIEASAGIEFRDHQHRFLYVGLAANNTGFAALNRFLTEHNLEKKALPPRAPQLESVVWMYSLASRPAWDQLRADEYVGLRYYELSFLFKIPPGVHPQLLAWHPVTHQDPSAYTVHQHLRAIDCNILLSQLKTSDLAHASERMPNPQQWQQLFASAPFLIQNVEMLWQAHHLHFDFKAVKNKQCYGDSKESDRHQLRSLAYQGMLRRYHRYDAEAKARVDKELAIIDQMNFSAYFLITWDIIQYSISKGYYHVGRGSGANSVVAYCLQITNVDPIELDLYFERFINPKRSSPPDFDIDYSWLERDDVQHYIFDRFGREHVALLGAMSTFVGKSIYRELGKVYGLPKEEIDDLIKYPHEPRNQHALAMQIHRVAPLLTNFPNMRSIHAGGILVSEDPITHYTSLDLPPKGLPTTQWDMYVAEDFGFEKLDILSQRGIGHIKDTVRLVKENQGLPIDYQQVERFKKDEKVRHLLQSGETLGCFYIESPAMRGLIRKLRCNHYLTLVAASSIIRPGVARSGMMREYILRYNQPDGFKYLHPVMEQQLKETFGVMVYQEDVLKVCHHFAGLDLADGDVLRRAMSGKTRSKEELNRIVNKFFSNCKEKGYPDELTREVWRQIESFAGYSFSKAHSASYAVESYQSLYLKAYFPLEFITGVINNFGGFYTSWVYFNEARRLGAQLMLPEINQSEYLTHIRGKQIYVGWVHVQNLERQIAKAIVRERKQNGFFTGLDDLISRVPMGIEQLLLVIRTGALNQFGKNKAELMWEAHSLINRHLPRDEQKMLFPLRSRTFSLPQLHDDPVVNAYDEIELIGFPLSCSYFDLLQTPFRGEIFARDLPQYLGKTLRMLGHLVTIKYVKTIKKDYMHFATFVDAKGQMFDTVHFPESVKAFPFHGDGIYLLLGKVVEEFGYTSLEVHKMAKMPLKANPLKKE